MQVCVCARMGVGVGVGGWVGGGGICAGHLWFSSWLE
jgi:hypothetical protein